MKTLKQETYLMKIANEKLDKQKRRKMLINGNHENWQSIIFIYKKKVVCLNFSF